MYDVIFIWAGCNGKWKDLKFILIVIVLSSVKPLVTKLNFSSGLGQGELGLYGSCLVKGNLVLYEIRVLVCDIFLNSRPYQI